MKKMRFFVIPVIICFLTGWIAGQFQKEALRDWYPFLDKPALTPPNLAFPIAWSLIYLLMGISLGTILKTQSPRKGLLVRLWGIQLFFNFIWSIAFFFLRSPLLGFVDILCLDVLVVFFIVISFRVRRMASFLFIPYLMWILFATYLNGFILFNN